MISFFKKIADFFIFSNIYVAVPVSLLVWETYALTGIAPDFHIIGLVYCSTLFLYGFHRLYGLEKVPAQNAADRHLWALRNKLLLTIIAGLAGVGSCILLLFVHPNVMISLIPLGALSLAYTIPVIKNKVRLRDIPGIKIFLITLTVSFVTVILPLLPTPDIIAAHPTEMTLFFLERALFIFAITIPFDIRDMDYDQTSGLKTMPLLFGKRRAILIAFGALTGFMLLSFLHFTLQKSIGIFELYPLLISGVISALIIACASPQRKEYYFSLLVEGTMVIQFLLIILFHFWAVLK